MRIHYCLSIPKIRVFKVTNPLIQKNYFLAISLNKEDKRLGLVYIIQDTIEGAMI
jgi:hypothetical protein